MDNRSITITGRDVVTKINVDGNQQTITQGPNTGQPYFRARFDGKGFIVTEEFFNKWSAGEVDEVNLTPSSYDVDDPMTPGEKIKRESWQLSAWATYEQTDRINNQLAKRELGAKRLDVEKRKLDIEMDLFEKKSLADLKLDEAAVSRLQDAV